MSIMKSTQRSHDIDQQMVEYSEEIKAEMPEEANYEEDFDGSDYQAQLKADNEFFEQNKSLLSNTDKMIGQYNEMIKGNLAATKDMLSSKPTGPLKHATSGLTSLHPIDEIDAEGDIRSDKAIGGIGAIEEAKVPNLASIEQKIPLLDKKQLKSSLMTSGGVAQSKHHESVSARTGDAQSNQNMDKVIGMLGDLENDLKQSYHKDKAGGFFEKRNKNNSSILSKKGQKDTNKKSLLPDVSFENETISTSSRVYEHKQKNTLDGDGKTAKIRIKKKKLKMSDKSGIGLPPTHNTKKV